MHLQISNFLERFIRESGVRTLSGRAVVEIGSYDLNGSAREVLQPGTASYVGVDWREGPGVDVVSLGHVYRPGNGQSFDVAVSCQALEHDPHWRATLARLVGLVASPDREGWVIVTCAGPGYVPHELDTAPPWPGHGAQPWYENRTKDEIRDALAVTAIVLGCDVDVYATTDRDGLDVLVWAKVGKVRPTYRAPGVVQHRLRDWYSKHDKSDLRDRVLAFMWALGEAEKADCPVLPLTLLHLPAASLWATLDHIADTEHEPHEPIGSGVLVYACLTVGLVPLDDAEMDAWSRAGMREWVQAGLRDREAIASWETLSPDLAAMFAAGLPPETGAEAQGD